IVWTVATFFEDEVRHASTILLLGKIDFSAALLIGYFFLNFALLFSSRTHRFLKFSQLPLLTAISAFVLLISFTNLIIRGVESFGENFHFVSGPFTTIYDLLLITLLLSGVWVLVRRYVTSTGLAKTQSLYVMGGFFISTLVAVATAIILPKIFTDNPPILARLGIYGLLFLIGSTTYAIVRHRLLDIEVIIRRSVVYSTLLAILIGMYSLLVSVLNRVFLPGTAAGAFPKVTDLIAIVIVAFSVDPLRKYIERATDKIFFKARYNAEEIINQLSETLVSEIDLTQLTREIKKVLVESIKVSKVSIYVKSDHRFFPIATANDFPKQLDTSVEKKHLITAYLTDHHEILVLEEAERSLKEGKRLHPHLAEAAKTLGKIGVEVVVPLVVKGRLNGAMFLGEKLSQDIYSGGDLRFLEILSHQAALSLENAKLYEEQKLYGVRLTKEVERATTDLRHANERLKELDKLKDEFMSIASHELRTPMTAIKSYVWLALNGRGGEIGMKVRDYLTKVYDSSERMIAMINDMLNVSRIETGRMQLEIVPVSIQKVLDQVTGDLSARAGEAGIEIKVQKEQIIPLVSTDRDKLAEIFTNLIGNALKFTPKGGTVTVSAQKKGDVVETSVADTGVGISEENIGKLFKKYGKIDESYATMTPSTGTGLGLYITKQYLEKMNGNISVKSTVGKGTIFTFSLPIATGAVKETEDKKEVAAFVPRRVIK
ncbi:MAG TPA: ATP-binding protein, partial [Candidatus Nanoarchaeia archaeon]